MVYHSFAVSMSFLASRALLAQQLQKCARVFQIGARLHIWSIRICWPYLIQCVDEISINVLTEVVLPGSKLQIGGKIVFPPWLCTAVLQAGGSSQILIS